MTRTSKVIIIFVALVSGYFILQCTSVVAYSNFSRSIVVSTRLLTVEFLAANIIASYVLLKQRARYV